MTETTFNEVERAELRAGIRARTVTPKAALAALKATRQANEVPALIVDRNKWMAFAFILLLLLVFAFVSYVQASARARNNTQVIYLKMYKDGHWDVDMAESNREVEFMPSVVDSILKTWIQRRFQEQAGSVRNDYGYANLLMSPQLAGAFMDPAQGNAIKKAAKIVDCAQCSPKQVFIRTLSHYDSENVNFGKIPGVVYRTNAFIAINTVNKDSGVIDHSDRKIVAIEWRLMTKAEILANVRAKDGQDWLQADPIGLQITKYELLGDPSADSSSGSSSSTSSDVVTAKD